MPTSANRLDLALELCRELSPEAIGRRVFHCAPSEVIRRIEEEGLFEGQARRTPGGQYRVPLAAVLKAQGAMPDLDEEDQA